MHIIIAKLYEKKCNRYAKVCKSIYMQEYARVGGYKAIFAYMPAPLC
jgi:hypothetical protein